MINIVCDDIATNTTEAVLSGGGSPSGPTIMELPYEGSGAMLRIEQTWIISKYKEALYRTRMMGPTRTYCNERYGWIDEVFDMVSWHSVVSVHKKLTHTKRMQTCKIMHG